MKYKLNLKAVKAAIIKYLKGAGIKLALKKILGSAIMGGFRAWLIKFVVTELFEEIGEPLIKAAFVKLGYYYDRIEGKIQVKRIEDAREANNEDDYINASNDVFKPRSK